MSKNEIEVDVIANKENLEDALGDLKEATDMLDRPNVVVRNRGDVYLTINYWPREKMEVDS